MNKELKGLVDSFEKDYGDMINEVTISNDLKKLLDDQKNIQKELLNALELKRNDIIEIKQKELKEIETLIINHSDYSNYCDYQEDIQLINNIVKDKVKEMKLI